MRLRVPPPLAPAITAIELNILDGEATCTPPDASGGNVLATFSLQLGEPRTIKVSPGLRTFSVVAYDERTPVARGCDQQTLVAGRTHEVTIDLVELPPPVDAAPPDAPPPDATPPPLNDDCSTAGPLVAGALRTDSSLGAADDEDGTCAGGGGSRDLIYTYTLDDPSHVHLAVSTDYDAAVSLRSPDCVDQQDEALCIDDVGGAGSEEVDVRTQPAGTYYVVVDGVGGEAGETSVLLTASDPPPPGDWCPEVLPLATGDTIGQTLSAAYGGDDAGSCGGAGRDRVYQFPLASPRQVDITTQGDLAHVVYLRSAACAGGAEVDCAASAPMSGDQVASLHFDELPSGLYYLFVDGTAADAIGTFTVTLTVSSSATPPPNDSCAAPEGLLAGLTEIGTVDAAHDDEVLSCAPGSNADVFYSFSLATTRSVTVSLSSSFDSVLSLETAGCAAELACVNATTTGELFNVGNLGPGSYVVAVESLSGATGDFTIGYTTGPPRPANDDCPGATLLFPNVPQTGQVMTDALDDAAGSCESGADPDVVYRFVVSDDQRARIRVSNATGFDPLLHLHQNACDGSELACAQTSTGGSDVLDLPDLEAGTYYVWVEAAGGGAGTFDILLELLDPVAPPGNDQCPAPELLTAEGAADSGSTVGAADDYDLSCAPSDGRDTVHELTLASARAVLVTLEAQAPPWDLAAALRPAAACADAAADLACTASGEATRYLTTPNLPAGTYDVIVDGVGGVAGDYSIAYETRPADLSFGYWVLQGLATYVPLSGATSVAIAQGGPPNGQGDEGFYAIPLPFSFPYYEGSYDTIFAHVNMFLTFATPPPDSEAYLNDCPVNSGPPYDAIELFWTDAYVPDTAPTGQLLYKSEGTAPSRKLTIEYRNFDLYHCAPGCAPIGARVSNQLVLHENGDIELRYGPRTAAPVPIGCGSQQNGCNATIGIEGQVAGVDDVSDMVQCNQSTIAEGQVIYFVRPR